MHLLFKRFKKTFKTAAALLIGGYLAFFSPLSIINSQLALAAPSYAVGFEVDKAQAARGEQVTFTMIVTNNGDVNLTNVTIIQDQNPAFTTYVVGSALATKGSATFNPPDAWYSDPQGTNLGTLTPGQAVTLRWKVAVNNDAPQAQTLEDRTGVRSSELQNSNVYSKTFTVAVNQSRNSLCASKTADKTTAAVGETITFTVRVCNDGDVKQTNIELYDRLHKEFTYKAGTTRATVRGVTSTVTDAWIGTETTNGSGLQINELNSGEEATITFQVTLNSQATNGQVIQNAVQYRSAQLPEWQQCAVQITANVPTVVKARIIVKKVLSPSTDTTKFNFSGSLSGSIGHNETLSADVDPGQYTTTETLVSGYDLTSISCDSASGSGDLGNRKATFNVSAGQTVTCTFTNTKQTIIVTSPNCSLTKKVRLVNGNEVTSVDAGTHVFTPGEEITYRLFVSNPGSGEGTNFSIVDTLPTYIFWVRGDGSYDSGANKVTFNLGTLKAGESKTLTYTAKVRDQIPAGQLSQQNSAQLTFSGGSCTSSVPLVISRPGQILAAAVLPQTGIFSTAALGTLSLLGTGFILRLRRIKKYRYWNQ